VRVVLSGLTGFFGLLGCLPAMCSPMMLDSPGAARNPATMTLVVSVAAFPLSCILAIIFSGGSSRRRDGSLWWFLLPGVNLVVGVSALCWCLIVYGGRFSG